MRITYFFLLLWTCCAATAQELPAASKGVSPLSNDPPSALAGQTWAVVVGISDYQDRDIPDLSYAHKDAEAFANYLRSPAGGSLGGDHLIVLLNSEATAGRIAEALDGLIEQAKEGDRVIIYFSGHGDVERKTISQPGFLLCWDSPSRVYMGGGTYSLAYLQEIINTLSTQNLAKVVVITDACHAGKLAGNQIGGSQLTASNLARQYANEVKVLSCQPGEFSLEGLQWGGGRGCFSYHLLEALYGLADRNADGQVTLGEVDRYLEDHVSAEVAPQSQVPILLGNKTEPLAIVHPQTLAALQKNKSSQVLVFASTESRGLEDEVLTGLDSGARQQYFAFKKAVREKRFFDPEHDCAEWHYKQLIQNPALLPLHNAMRRNYAAALQDDAQKAINEYIQMPNKEILRRRNRDQNYSLYPKYLARAADLLGPSHYLYQGLQAREKYFEGLIHRLDGEQSRQQEEFQIASALQHQVLELDSNAAYAWNELGLLERRMKRYRQSIQYFDRALLLAPGWVMAYTNLAATYIDLDEYPKAEQACWQALAIDSSFAIAQYNLGLVYYYQQTDWKRAREQFLKALSFDPDYSNAFFKLGILDYREGNYAGAQTYWKEYVQREPSDPIGFNNLGYALFKQGRLDEAADCLQKAIRLDDGYADPALGMASVQAARKQITQALAYVELAIAKRATYEQLQQDEELAPLRLLPEWKELMKKYFPDKG